MDQSTIQTLFPLLRYAICGGEVSPEQRQACGGEALPELLRVAQKQDVAHLVAFALSQNGMIPQEQAAIEKIIFKAVYRFERLNDEYLQVCDALEAAQIPFVPLKGSVLRQHYPEGWMRTSCDIDILVHREELEHAISYLTDHLAYVEKERGTHDVSLFSPSGNHIELHFDLVEEDRANNAIKVLSGVWNDVRPHENCQYRCDMSDSFFYFYHIAHMAKHFENGGCGIRPFLDLWILDHMVNADHVGRDALLEQGGLLQFAQVCRRLSKVWLGGEEMDAVSLQMQSFILDGGVYGSHDNRVALQQKKKGGRVGYILSRIFVSYAKLKRYYPVLEKHPWLFPFMQVRRWFMLLRPDVAKMAKRELAVNSSIDREKTDQMNAFLKQIGL